MNAMKKIFLLSIAILALFTIGLGCDITMKIEKEKTVYRVGDELIVKVVVSLTHGNCPISIKAVEFTTENLKILQGTEWKEKEPGVWERKLKVVVIETQDKTAKLTAQRKCDKGGDKEVLSIKL
jgi:hypothetical protein